MGSLVDDVIAAIHIKRFACDQTCRVVCKESRGHTDIVDAYEAARGRLCFGLVE
jgi:hypothetical protein